MGEKCLFRVDSKSFEISKEMVKGKVVDLITKRGRGFSSWIKFGERGFV